MFLLGSRPIKCAECSKLISLKDISSILKNDEDKVDKLLKLSVELSEKVSSFVRVIKRAEKLENEKHNGMSLTWYLKAKSIYPKSTYAKSGMNRLLNTILPADIENISEENSSEEKPLKLNF